MKTILIPTDFSTASDSALAYASELALVSNATLIVFHVYHFPIVNTYNAEILALPLDDVRESCELNLQAVKDQLLSTYPGLKLETVCKLGFAKDEIDAILTERKVDLLIMGMKEADFLTEKILGSTTTSLLENKHCPVLIVRENSVFKSIQKIALAYDEAMEMNPLVESRLKMLVDIFKPHIYFLRVVPVDGHVSIPDTIESINYHAALVSTAYSFHLVKNDDVTEGINQFVLENQVDLVVMMPREHTFFQRLFHEPKTRNMAFHGNQVLMAIPGV
ncbi:MAG: universal stress protein [Crocinitomicaceae bacterium]|nr:universal stress protein [Crocinitomicaceae bacterium]